CQQHSSWRQLTF
nr:immunoglobulin light chain junction region [Macaca mulatta]